MTIFSHAFLLPALLLTLHSYRKHFLFSNENEANKKNGNLMDGFKIESRNLLPAVI